MKHPYMKFGLCTLALLGLLCLGCSNNKAAEKDSAASGGASGASTASNPDQDFVINAAKGNREEVQLGTMVAAKTKDSKVKSFAQMMVKDHTAALGELTQLAQTKNINLPEGLPDDAAALQTKLTTDTGKTFDKDYMDAMVDDHKKDVSEFQDASQNAKDPDVKQWATKTLPTLQKHLDKAEQLDGIASGGKMAK